MRSSLLAPLAPLALALTFAGCSAQTDDAPNEEPTGEENAVKVDTRSAAARAQYDADVAFLSSYRATCKPTQSGKKRVIVTGFGRFQGIANNATGRMVASLLPNLAYPETSQPPAGQIDPPGPQLAVGQGLVTLPKTGEVEVCAMVLPVYWYMAAILLSKEIEAFAPDFVMMNGVAGTRQDVWLELGSVNKAAALDDGSDQLKPVATLGSDTAPILESAGPEDQARPNLLSWRTVESAARAARDAAKDEVEGGTRFGDVVQGVKLAGYPRGSNTYLCNNITYITGYLMDHPGRTAALLRASPRVPGKVNAVRAGISRDTREVPRVFAHWPSELAERHTARGKSIMLAILDAQLSHAVSDAPKRGSNADAAPGLQSGETF